MMGRNVFAYNIFDQAGRPRPSQEDAAIQFVCELADEVCKRINEERDRITRMDTRIEQTWTPEQPEVFNPYVTQALLEKVIEILQQRV